MQRRGSLRPYAAVFVGLGLLASACGGDDGGSAGSGETATDDTIDASINSALKNQLTSTSEGGDATATTVAAKDEPASMEEWEALWKEERAAIVERIKENKWGLSADGKTITGPEGFTIDLSTCAAGWSNTEGITDTEFKIGQSIAQSGTLADYGN